MTNATALLDSLPTDLWIGGVQARPQTERTFAVLNPATGEVLLDVADAAAADGACAARGANASKTPARRAQEPSRRIWIISGAPPWVPGENRGFPARHP
jgi:succinate-semialdehyde dehydrogenase/glutarate-semialdehyde dehydrogenase